MKKCLKRCFLSFVCLMLVCATVGVAYAETYLVIDGFSFLGSSNGGIIIHGYNKSNTDVVIPESIADLNVDEIADYAFLNCTDMPSISFRKAKYLKKIGYAAFSNCKSIEKLVLVNSIENISSAAFQGCSSLASVTISNSMTEIPSYAFYNCSSLNTVYIPKSVVSIGYNAFGGCTALSSITIPSTVTSIDKDAFYACTDLVIKGESGSYAEQFASENGFTFVEGKSYDVGDVNRDGKINIKDATEIQKYLAHIISLDAEALILADYTVDETVNILDATQIQKFLAKLI